MSIFCTKCVPPLGLSNVANWKRHMTDSHGGYQDEDLKKAGVRASSSDRARGLSGYESLKAVQNAAPSSESAGDGKATGTANQQGPSARRPRSPKLTPQEIERQEKVRKIVNKYLIGENAGVPYDLAAWYFADQRWMLSEEDEEALNELYSACLDAYGADLSNPKWLLLTAILMNGKLVGQRVMMMIREQQPASETPQKGKEHVH